MGCGRVTQTTELAMLAADIDRMLTDYGQTITLRRKAITMDRVALTSTSTETDVSIIAHVSTFDEGQRDGTRIRDGDIKVISDKDTVVEEDDSFIINSEEYQIMSVRAVNHAGTVLGYISRARK